MSNNKNLQKAKKNKNDEFYTRYEDIDNELKHYIPQLKNKIIYCNCDNPKYSNFFKYFVINFERFGIRKLITTHYTKDETSFKLEYEGNKTKLTKLEGNGDFASNECIEILKESDIVITNPPFSLFRKFFDFICEFNKKFLILGTLNAITYKNIFPKIKNNEINIGYTFPSKFYDENKNIKKLNNIIWLTNLFVKDKEKIELKCYYSPEKYFHYENYNAINVDKVKDIPCDFFDVMGVPISFISKYNKNQFEIISMRNYELIAGDFYYLDKQGNKVRPYQRILIRRKK